METISFKDCQDKCFEDTLNMIKDYFLYKIQLRSTPSYASLLNRWEKLWFLKDEELWFLKDKDTTSYYIVYQQKAADELLSFYKSYFNKQNNPVQKENPS